MTFRYLTAHDALMDRADRAIEDASSLRAEVRAGLLAAGQRRPVRPCPGDMRPSSSAPPLGPLPLLELLEPWWFMARALVSAGEIIREADCELSASWNRTLPTLAATRK